MITVYHWEKRHGSTSNRMGFGLRPEAALCVMHDQDPDLIFQKKAEVDTNDLEHAFQLTNHIDSDWTLNPQVKVFYGSSNRSSSPGDVFRTEDGKYHIVWVCGFKELPVGKANTGD